MNEKRMLAIIGVGNTLAGNDGLGVEVIRRLEKRWGTEQGILLHTLAGDHFEIADLLGQSGKFVFVDAVEGEHPGELVTLGSTRRAFAPSFHQADVATVMHMLEAIGIIDPFPSWEIWGITISPPSELGAGLSQDIEEAVEQLCQRLCWLIEETIRPTCECPPA